MVWDTATLALDTGTLNTGSLEAGAVTSKIQLTGNANTINLTVELQLSSAGRRDRWVHQNRTWDSESDWALSLRWRHNINAGRLITSHLFPGLEIHLPMPLVHL